MSMVFRWMGPFRVGDYLDHAVSRDPVWKDRWPPAGNGVYLVSRDTWTGQPTEASCPLYIGGNTGTSTRFCTRIGDLIADLFGFFDGDTGHHSGGQKLWRWCDHHQVPPASLFLAWASAGDAAWCARCAEGTLFESFPRATSLDHNGLLNKVRPPACGAHSPT
jgi:hypothetical protein